jgi:hypothetical protein
MGMTDQALVNKLLSALYTSSSTFTITPGTGGGSAFTITPPFRLHLFSTTGTETATGTENVSGTSPGYTGGYPSGGLSLGSSAFTTFTSGASTTPPTALTWTATGTWTLGVAGIEIWDSAATAIRYLWGPLTTAIGASVVVNGDTVSFAIGSVQASGAAW